MSEASSNQATAVTGDAPVAPDEELAPGTHVGEFRIEKLLGRGGMGTVYGAVHTRIGKRGAVKVLHTALCQDQVQVGRFVQEARAINQIGHPNIVDVFAFGELPDGRSYMVMEWLVGESLRARIRRGPLPRDEIRDVMTHVIRALEAAHEHGIIHRDLKPDNVFLVEVPGERPRAKLLDFGVAKLTGEGRNDQTKFGAMLGTPHYIAPEQARGEPTPESDVYALGIMLFELVSGHTPFSGTTTMEVVSHHMLEPPPRLSTVAPDISPDLDALVDAMLAKEPGDRPTLAQVRSRLAELSADANPHPQSAEFVRPPRRRRLALALAALLVIGVAAVTFAAVRSARSGGDDGSATNARVATSDPPDRGSASAPVETPPSPAPPPAPPDPGPTSAPPTNPTPPAPPAPPDPATNTHAAAPAKPTKPTKPTTTPPRKPTTTSRSRPVHRTPSAGGVSQNPTGGHAHRDRRDHQLSAGPAHHGRWPSDGGRAPARAARRPAPDRDLDRARSVHEGRCSRNRYDEDQRAPCG